MCFCWSCWHPDPLELEVDAAAEGAQVPPWRLGALPPLMRAANRASEAQRAPVSTIASFVALCDELGVPPIARSGMLLISGRIWDMNETAKCGLRKDDGIYCKYDDEETAVLVRGIDEERLDSIRSR